jgi:hypothetical protein
LWARLPRRDRASQTGHRQSGTVRRAGKNRARTGRHPLQRFEDAPPAKQQIACNRSFGHPITELYKLQEAITEFACRAAKSCAKNSHTAQLMTFIRTTRSGKKTSKTSAMRASHGPTTRQQLTLGLHADMPKNTIRLMQAMDQIKRRCGRLRWNVKRLEFADRPVG